MEVKLENIIEKLRKEGVEGAKQESEAMLEKARKEADALVKAAKQEAEDMKAEGGRKAEQFQKNAELAIKQAGRDAQLLLKEQILSMLDRVFKKQIAETLKPEFLRDLIMEVLKSWDKGAEVEILVNDKDKKKLESLLLSRLKRDARDTLTLKPSQEIAHGFRIGTKGEDVYYDFTEESIAEMLGLFLNPQLNDLIGKTDG
jgi:V/A-type H+-transporting ATPase subunit E